MTAIPCKERDRVKLRGKACKKEGNWLANEACMERWGWDTIEGQLRTSIG